MRKTASTLLFVIILSAGLVSAVCAAGKDNQKRTYRYDIKRSGYTGLDISPPFKLAWFFNTNQTEDFVFAPKISCTLAAAGKTLYHGTLSNSFAAFDTVSKSYIWRYETKGIVHAGATLEGDRLYFGDSKGYMYCLDKDTGDVYWQHGFGNEILSSPLIVEDKIYFTDMDDSLYCISKDKGLIHWKVESGSYLDNIVMRGPASPSYDNGYIYQGFSDGYLYCFDADSAKEIFKKKVKGKGKFFDVDTPAAIDGRFVYSSSFDGNFLALKATGPETIWALEIKGNGYPAYNKESLFIASSEGMLYKVDKQIGNVIWEKELSFDLTAPIVTDKYIFVASHDYFYVVDILSGDVLYEYEPGSGINSELCLVDDSIYFMSNKGYIYCFKSTER